MLKIALTGSIGMGKSTALEIFKFFGIAGVDSDKIVHAIYENPDLNDFKDLFSDVIIDGQIDRKSLAEKLVQKPELLVELEKIIHPQVSKKLKEFNDKYSTNTYTIFDIPLLFEKKKETDYQIRIVITAPFSVQKDRVLARTHMTAEKFNFIISHQMDDISKKKKAHFIILSYKDIQNLRAQIKSFLRSLAYIQAER
jgi:dephospho-CoA kinase